VNSEIFQDLAAQRGLIRANWENLLRLERAISPLANPDALVHLLDTTLDEIFRDLPQSSLRRYPIREPEPHCPCGHNPLLAYFGSGHQALREALVMIQAGIPALDGNQRDEALGCLEQVYGHISRREIESFCAVCQFRNVPHPAVATIPCPRVADRP